MMGQYAAFILPAYAVSFVVIAVLAGWIYLTYRQRLREIEALEAQGARRRSGGSGNAEQGTR